MENSLFRKKSLERIASPEQMDDYIRVIGPNAWIVLAAVVLLLAGVIVWGIFGSLETADDSVAIVQGGVAVCYVTEDIAGELDADDYFKIGDSEIDIKSVSNNPILASEVYDEDTLAGLGLAGDRRLYAVSGYAMLADGAYEAEVIIEKIHPMSFITGED